MLSVYSNGNDWVIAESSDDAFALYAQHTGTTPADHDDCECHEFEVLPDDKPMTVLDEDGVNKETRTCREWADLQGRSYLASQDY